VERSASFTAANSSADIVRAAAFGGISCRRLDTAFNLRGKQMKRAKPRAFIAKPQLRKARPIGTQPDMFGGPPVPVFTATNHGETLRRTRIDLGLSAKEAGRACSMSAEEWATLESGGLLVVAIGQIRHALQREGERKELPEGAFAE
jgi:hypothetical protein